MCVLPNERRFKKKRRDKNRYIPHSRPIRVALNLHNLLHLTHLSLTRRYPGWCAVGQAVDESIQLTLIVNLKIATDARAVVNCSNAHKSHPIIE